VNEGILKTVWFLNKRLELEKLALNGKEHGTFGKKELSQVNKDKR